MPMAYHPPLFPQTTLSFSSCFAKSQHVLWRSMPGAFYEDWLFQRNTASTTTPAQLPLRHHAFLKWRFLPPEHDRRNASPFWEPHPPRVSESMTAHDVVNGGGPPSGGVACQAHESRVRMGGRDDSLKDNDASCTENPSVIETFSPRHAETTYPSCVDAVDIMTSRETRHSRKCVRQRITKEWFGATTHADVSTLIKKHVNGEASRRRDKLSKSRTIGMLVLFDEPLGIALLRSVGSLPKLEALSCAQRTSWCSFDVALDFVRGKKTVSEKQLYERLKIASDHYHASTRSYWEEAEVDVARTLESSAIEELLHCVGNKVLVKMDAEQLTSQMQQDEMNEAVNNCGFYKDEITRLAASLIHEKSTIAQLETACAELQSTMSYDELTDRVEALKKLIKKTRKPPKKM